FFQAEDGIRDLYVTGVQTCALPIYSLRWHSAFGLAQGIAVAVALPWLGEWVRYWWLTMPARPTASSVRLWSQWDWPTWATATAEIGRASCREREESAGVVVPLKKTQ